MTSHSRVEGGRSLGGGLDAMRTMDDDEADGGGAQSTDKEQMVQSENAGFRGHDGAAATILQGRARVPEG